MMDKNKIEYLLQKFWDAETSAQEERALQEYFTSGEVDSEFQYAKSYFTSKLTSEETGIEVKIISKLIEKYFNTETSVEEESLIKEYFNQDNIHSSLKAYKGIFSSYNQLKSVTFKKELRLKENTPLTVENKTEAKVISLKWVKVAAAAVVLFSGSYFIYNANLGSDGGNTFAHAQKAKIVEIEDPEEAYKETMKALALVSKKYRVAEDHMLDGFKTMNESNIMK